MMHIHQITYQEDPMVSLIINFLDKDKLGTGGTIHKTGKYQISAHSVSKLSQE